MLKQVSDEGEVQEIEESTSDDEEQDPSVLHGIDEQSETERERHANSVDNGMHIVLPQWRKFKNIFARISRTGAGANIVCLVVESAPNIDDEILVKIR